LKQVEIFPNSPSVSSDAFAIGGAAARHIQRVVCARYGVALVDLLSERRTRYVARARQIAVWLCRHATPLSLPQIGRAFRRDHTTILYSVNHVDALMAADPALDAELRAMRFALTPAELRS
jgi:chromosomal replication initiator protein